MSLDEVVLVLELEHKCKDDEELLDDVLERTVKWTSEGMGEGGEVGTHRVNGLAKLDNFVPVVCDRLGLVVGVPLVELGNKFRHVPNGDILTTLNAAAEGELRSARRRKGARAGRLTSPGSKVGPLRCIHLRERRSQSSGTKARGRTTEGERTVSSVSVVGSKLGFLFQRQVKNFLADGELFVHLLLRDAVPNDVKKSYGVYSMLELLSESFLASGLVERRKVEAD
jgi:hypothetical protein